MTVGSTNASQRVRRAKSWLFGFSLLALTGLHSHTAEAHSRHRHLASAHPTEHRHHYAYATHHQNGRLAQGFHRSVRLAHEYMHEHTHGRHGLRYAGYGRHHHYAIAQYRPSYLQCVPYAREVSHIELSGDAFLWWAEAAGRYARGSTPQEGAVLNFRPIGRMPLGHVAVVTAVIDNRTILVTQANWIPGTITNDVTVDDVSADNDWSQVEVELGDEDKVGSSYPTYGFIYNQPDDGTVIANSGAGVAQGNEVAEAPRPIAVSADAPDRNLQ